MIILLVRDEIIRASKTSEDKEKAKKLMTACEVLIREENRNKDDIPVLAISIDDNDGHVRWVGLGAGTDNLLYKTSYLVAHFNADGTLRETFNNDHMKGTLIPVFNEWATQITQQVAEV